MKESKSNNYGRGFWYQFADGTSGWVLGMSAQEKLAEIRKHGPLVKWIPA